MSSLLRTRAILVAVPTLLLLLVLAVINTDMTAEDGPANCLHEDFNCTPLRESLGRLGHGLEDLPHRSKLWTASVRLCVMFNLNSVGPSEAVINLLIAYYFPFFKHISLIFDGHPNYNFSSVPSFVDVLFCDSHLGFYQHKCIRQCIQQTNSETEGYLYISDDMFINITKMAELPKSEIWFLENLKRSMSWILNPPGGSWDWVWWAPPHNNSIKLKDTIDSFPTEWQDRLKRHHGFPDNFSVVMQSDIIFIPKRILPELLPVLEHIIVHQPELFCEVATALAVNVATAGFVRLDPSGYLWGERPAVGPQEDREKAVAAIEEKAMSAHFVHAIKLGYPGQADMWVSFMEQQLHHTVLGKNNLK